MKLLTNDQIKTIKQPNRLGRKKTSLTEVYEAAYDKADISFKNLKQIAELLPYMKKSPIKSKYKDFTIELFDAENFDPILSSIFPLGKEEGASTDNKTYFEESKINAQKAMFASKLLKFSGDYLLQAFPEQEYPNLHLRINELVNDLKGMTESFNRNQKLQKQLKELEEHVIYFEPIGLGIHDSHYDVACLFCRGMAMGKTIKEAIEKIKHPTKCIAPKEIEENNPNNWERWYKIQPPKQLLITWDERKLLDSVR